MSDHKSLVFKSHPIFDMLLQGMVCVRVIIIFVVMKSAVGQSIRADAMLIEDTGFLEAEDGEATADISQHDIVKQVDVQSAQKVSCRHYKQVFICLFEPI